jgi:hypothetical protein
MALTLEQFQQTEGPTLEPGDKAVQIIVLGGAVETGQTAAIGNAAVISGIAKIRARDIIVIGSKPFHFAAHQVREHPKVHHDCPDSILQLSVADKNRAVWWSTQPFTITNIEGDPEHGLKDAPYPFTSELKTIREDSLDAKKIHVVRSSVPTTDAIGFHYKITFEVNGHLVDPNIYCGD